ncbi:MAG: Zn-dependent hydrolase [SAR86 cluster bacterium]
MDYEGYLMTHSLLLLSLFISPLLFAADSTVDAGDTRVDSDRLSATMQHMRTFGENAAGGSDRVAYSEHNLAALGYLAHLMAESGLVAKIDVAGNLVGRREGRIDGLAPIVTGSHIDTVPNGGHYDGIVGVMSAVEVARSLREAGVELDHPLEVIVWSNEEGGKNGSRSFTGAVADREMALPSLGTKTIGEGIAFLGGDPQHIAANIRHAGGISGYIELHVEQGAMLDRDGIAIGVVEGIVGIKRWYITIEGFANHAGTTPMDQRQDALYPAALIIAEVRKIITDEPGRQVGTIGRLDVKPGAPNVIPGEVMFSLEIRDLDMNKVNRLFAMISAAATAIAEANETQISFNQYYESPAAPTDKRIMALVKQSADALGLSNIQMPSGAGHDAQSMKGIAPLGMIFVPSRAGISHAPGEFTGPQQISNGANVLLQTVVAMDRLLR